MSSDTLPIAILDDPSFDAHAERGFGHPECPERLEAARAGLRSAIPETARRALTARLAEHDELVRVHRPEHLKRLTAALGQGYGHIDHDTFFSPGSEEAAWRASGGCAQLVESLMRGEAERAIALVRPPGHHAEPGRSMGFCLINNIAVAAAHALSLGAARVAIVDWDVHHGNGTQAAFYEDPRVLFISLHQYPFYPGTGAPDEIGRGAGLGSTINLALPANQGPEAYAYAFRRVVLPALDTFKPELVLVSAGFDGHARDPLAQMALDAQSYQAMASSLLEHAQRAGYDRVGMVLEGGYDFQALHDCVHGVGRALMGQQVTLPEDPPSGNARRAVDYTVEALAGYLGF